MKRLLLGISFAFLCSLISCNTVKASNYYKGYNDYYSYTNINVLKKQGYTGQGINIAVLDTGIDNTHPAFIKDGGISKIKYNITCVDAEKGCVKYEGFDRHFHGTHVAGIIAGNKSTIENPDSIMNHFEGIAPNSTLFNINISNKENQFEIDNLKAGLLWIKDYNSSVAYAERIHIVNMSIGISSNSLGVDLTNIKYKEVNNILKDLYESGVLLVAGSGNSGHSDLSDVYFPARSPYVIAVGNYINPIAGISPTSSVGKSLELAAPGASIYSTVPLNEDKEENFIDEMNGTHYWDGVKDGYQQLSGTSMASPVVSATLALLKEKYPKASNVNLRDYLRLMANYQDGEDSYIDTATNQLRNTEYGYGALRADVGYEVNKKLILNTSTKIFNLPNTNYYAGASISPQTVTAVREGEKGSEFDGWYEVKTWIGYRWIKPLDYAEEVNMKVTIFNNTVLYGDSTKNISYGSITPQTVTANKKLGNWFEINTYLGPKWIIPTNYTIGDFKINLANREPIYFAKNGNPSNATISPQEVNVIFRSNEWFQVNSYLGDVWIKPVEYSTTYPMTLLNGPYNMYSSPTGGKETPYMTDKNITFNVHERIGNWFRAIIPGGSAWFNPTDLFFIGEYKLILNEEKTYLYNSRDMQEGSVGSLAPQTVTVKRKYFKSSEKETWFLIQTSIGLKWIKPKNWSYSEYQ